MSDIEVRLEELRKMAAAYARAKSQQVYLHEFRKSKLAILMKEAEKDGHQTAAAQDREARAHPQYIDLLDGLKVATEEAERLRWNLEISKLGADLWRTKQATKRSELAGYRG